MTCQDAPDWTDTAQIVVESAPTYPHSVYSLAGVTPVAAWGTKTGGTKTLYTVPAGKTFYLTHLWLALETNIDSAEYVYVSATNGPAPSSLFWILETRVHISKDTAMAFPVPIPVTAGGVFELDAGSNAKGWATIVGYTVDD